MIISQKRFRDTLQRVASPDLARLISDAVAFNSQLREGQNIPWKEFEKLLDDFAEKPVDPESLVFEARSIHDLREFLATQSAGRINPTRESVRLDRISLKNFGSYQDEETLELAPRGEKNVTVIAAGTGKGKSTLFHAINWALFGEDFLQEMMRAKGKDRLGLVNYRAADELKERQIPEVESSATLWFWVEGEKYYVRRRFSTTVLSSGELSPGLVTTSLYRIDPKGNHEPLNEDRLPSLLSSLPKNVKEFYLFDGEHINRFASPGSQEAVMSAIRRILGVRMLERAQENSAQLAKRFRSAFNRAAPADVKELAEQEEAKRDLIAHRESESARLNTSIVELRGMLRQLEEKLRTAPDTSELQKRRDLLHQQVADIVDRRIGHLGSLRKSMAGAFATIAEPAVNQFREGLGSLKEKGEIPGQISEQLITELLEYGRCICGRHIGEEDGVRSRLLSELDRAKHMAPLRSALLDIHARLGSVKALADSRRREAQRGHLGYFEETDSLADVDAALEGISLELEGVEEIDRESWEQERVQKQDELSIAMANLRSLEQQLKEDAVELKDLEKRLAEVAEKTKTAAVLNRKAGWTEAVSLALKSIVHEFATLARLDVERRTAALWHRLLPNTRQYTVQVTDGFELTVASPAGAGGLSQLSMGQQHCLGLAFITSVAQASESLPPLVIDMPFGRLDSEVAATVATEMPSLTNQLVLFILEGTEWNEHTRRALEPSLARVARLCVDPANSNTHIRTQD